MNTTIEWRVKTFEALTPAELYQLLRIRQEVFVLEQQCLYPDIDGADPLALHLLGYSGDTLAAYARIFENDPHYHTVSFGRIVVDKDFRQLKLGKLLVGKVIEVIEEHWGKVKINISAQQYLLKFYEGFGFIAIGNPYDEDGIAHIRMEKINN